MMAEHSLSVEQREMMRHLEKEYGPETALRYKQLITHPSYTGRKPIWRGNSIKLSNYEQRGRRGRKARKKEVNLA